MKLRHGLLREFLAAEGFELVEHLLRRAAAGGHESGRIHRSRFFRGEHAQRVDIHLQFVAEAFGAAFHFGDDAGRDLRKLLAEGAPYPGLKISGGVFQFNAPERAVLGLQLRRRADEVQRSDFVGREPRLWPTGGRARIVFSAYSTYNKKLCDRLSVRKASPYSRNVWREFTRFRLCCQQKACGPSGLRLSVCFLWENCFCCFGRLRAYLAFQR